MGYAAHSGLGHLIRDFYRHDMLQRILVLPHPNYTNFPEWYPSQIRHTMDDHEAFLDNIDVLLLFENAFQWQVPKKAHRRGIPIALIPNYEYTPFPPRVHPDLFICASQLDIDYYSARWPTTFIPIPVNTDKIPWRKREQALVFVHNAGHGGHQHRNGTPELLKALEYVKSPISLIVRAQPEEQRMHTLLSRGCDDKRVRVELKELPGEEDLWTTGDVYVAPEKYNGMSLPLQEAFAAGMLVMTTKRYPMTTWLPPGPMIPVSGFEKHRMAVTLDRAVIDPRSIAKVIDQWYGTDISAYSILGAEWAQNNSWDVLRPKYLQALASLL